MTDKEKELLELKRRNDFDNFELAGAEDLETLNDNDIVRANWFLDGDSDSRNVVSASVNVSSLRNGQAQKQIAAAMKETFEKSQRPEIEKLKEDYKLYFDAYHESIDTFNSIRSRLGDVIRHVIKEESEIVNISGHDINLRELQSSMYSIHGEIIQTPWSEYGRGLGNTRSNSRFNRTNKDKNNV